MASITAHFLVNLNSSICRALCSGYPDLERNYPDNELSGNNELSGFFPDRIKSGFHHYFKPIKIQRQLQVKIVEPNLKAFWLWIRVPWYSRSSFRLNQNLFIFSVYTIILYILKKHFEVNLSIVKLYSRGQELLSTGIIYIFPVTTLKLILS